MMAITLMYAWSRNNAQPGVAVMNGPTPARVPQIAIADTSTIAVAAARRPSRKATQTRIGIGRNSRECSAGNRPPNTPALTTPISERARKSSDQYAQDRRMRGAWLQRSKNGATTRAPAASPSHHVSQMDG